MQLLHIDSSIFTENSVSRTLSARIVDAWRQTTPSLKVIRRDVGLNPPAHLSADVITALRTGEIDTLTPAQLEEVRHVDLSIKELESSDGVVIGVPMYNHSVPSGLKAWIDQICQAGRTFRYTEKGPQGLLKNRPIIIASSRGGFHSGVHAHGSDFQEAYLTSIFGLLGVRNVQMIRAEGLNVNEALRKKAIAEALHTIDEHFANAEA